MRTKIVGICLLVLLQTGCGDPVREEQTARTYCSSCHAFPEPGLLDKSTWVNSVIPQMAFRMGVKNPEIFSRIASSDLTVVLKTIPKEPIISERQLSEIRNYYYHYAPETIEVPDVVITDSVTQFEVYPAPAEIPLITVMKFDSAARKIYVGNRSSQLYRLDGDWTIEKSIKLNSPATHISVSKDGLFACLIGIILPNDQKRGSLVEINSGLDDVTLLADSLRRPVYFDKADLNGDGKDEFVVSSFGHYTGALELIQSQANHYNVSEINPMPGARKTVIRDFNDDGLPDILALLTQGDERILLYLNKGKLTFEEKVLLRFPAVYGSSYFELTDFNRDGHPDILYVNGDNGDFTPMLKPYHGLKIFLNDGLDNFAESWSFPMPGAQEARAVDFDQDGDLDIAAISYFPDFDNHPERSFLYLENQGDNTSFKPHVLGKATIGRWLTMETGDIDNDGDEDLWLGSMSVKGLGAGEDRFQEWYRNRASILVLENRGRNTKAVQ